MKSMKPTMKKQKQWKQLRRGLAKVALVSLPALGVMLTPPAAYAVGEQDGRISGVVTDKQSGLPMPGVRVRLTGKNLIGGARNIASSDDGSYEFIALPPGPYELELTIEGLQVKPLRRRVIVRQGETFPLNIAWSPEEAKQEVKVIYEERKMTKPDSTQTGTVLSADQQARVATQRSYQNIAQQVAGVTGGGNPNIKGAMNAHNRYMVDGLDITDPVTNTFSANINFDSIESVEVLTGGTEAEYNSLGGLINLVTSAGSNEWHVDSSLYINHQSLSAGSQFGPQFYDGARPFAVLKRSPNEQYQANINIGGPIIKDKWWFHFSYQYQHTDSSINIGPPLNLQHPTRQFRGHYIRFKTAIAPSPKHRLTLAVSADPATIGNTNQDNFHLGVAEDYQAQGGAFTILTWDYFASEKVNTKIQTGFQLNTIDTGPQGYFGSIDNSAYKGTGRFSPANDEWVAERPQHVNNSDGTTWYQGGSIFLDKRYTFQFDPSISLRGNAGRFGKHEAKFGFQGRYIRHTGDFRLPGGATYADNGGGPLESGICEADGNIPTPAGMPGNLSGCYQKTTQDPYTNVQDGFSMGFFAQDRWKVNSWLRINPGLRFDYGRTTNSRGEVVSNLWGFGPRLGLVFDITQDQKTIFTAYYGRSNEVLSLLAAAYADVTSVATTYQFNPDVNMGKGGWDMLYQSGGPGGYALRPDGTPPHTDEITLSMRREAFQNSVVGVDYTYKRVGNIWDSQEINQIWDPSGQRVVRYADGKPQQVFLYTTFDQNWRVYQGVDFIFESRPRQEWDFAVIYTLSWLYGPGAEQFAQISGSQTLSQFYNPRLAQFYDGFLPEDRRHQLKIRASYQWKGLTFGAFLNYQSGTPRTKRFFNAYDGGYTYLRSPSGTEPGNDSNSASSYNDLTRIAEFRVPSLLVIDARVTYDLASLFTDKVHLQLIADVFNVFNLDTPTGVVNRDLATFGQVTTRQAPLRAQLGLRIMY